MGTGSYGPQLVADDTYFYTIVRSLTDAKVYRSSDGSAWTLIQTITSANFPWFVAWDDGLYYYDGDSVYRSIDGATTFSLYMGRGQPGHMRSRKTRFAAGRLMAFITSTTRLSVGFVCRQDQFFPAVERPPSALSTYSSITGVFADDFLFLACYRDATHTYVAQVAVPSADYVLSSVIADQPSDHSSGYAFLPDVLRDGLRLSPGGSGVWRTPIQTTQAATITTIGALAGSEQFDFAQSTLWSFVHQIVNPGICPGQDCQPADIYAGDGQRGMDKDELHIR